MTFKRIFVLLLALCVAAVPTLSLAGEAGMVKIGTLTEELTEAAALAGKKLTYSYTMSMDPGTADESGEWGAVAQLVGALAILGSSQETEDAGQASFAIQLQDQAILSADVYHAADNVYFVAPQLYDKPLLVNTTALLNLVLEQYAASVGAEDIEALGEEIPAEYMAAFEIGMALGEKLADPAIWEKYGQAAGEWVAGVDYQVLEGAEAEAVKAGADRAEALTLTGEKLQELVTNLYNVLATDQDILPAVEEAINAILAAQAAEGEAAEPLPEGSVAAILQQYQPVVSTILVSMLKPLTYTVAYVGDEVVYGEFAFGVAFGENESFDVTVSYDHTEKDNGTLVEVVAVTVLVPDETGPVSVAVTVASEEDPPVQGDGVVTQQVRLNYTVDITAEGDTGTVVTDAVIDVATASTTEDINVVVNVGFEGALREALEDEEAPFDGVTITVAAHTEALDDGNFTSDTVETIEYTGGEGMPVITYTVRVASEEGGEIVLPDGAVDVLSLSEEDLAALGETITANLEAWAGQLDGMFPELAIEE